MAETSESADKAKKKSSTRGLTATFSTRQTHVKVLNFVRKANSTTGADGKNRSAALNSTVNGLVGAVLVDASPATLESLEKDLVDRGLAEKAALVRSVVSAREQLETAKAPKTVKEALKQASVEQLKAALAAAEAAAGN